MSKPKVFVTRILPDIGMEMLHQIAEIEVWPDRLPPPYEILLEKVKGKDGLLCLLTDKIDKNLLEISGSSLKVISQMAVGYDNIDIAAATTKRIPVGHTPGVLTDATADLTWALLMTASRRILEADKFTRSGEWKTWEPILLLGADISGATLGIVGCGRIGQAVARRAAGFGMRILYYNKQRLEPSLEESLGLGYREFDVLLAESDFITIHTSLSEDTYHLFSDAQFQRMKQNAILINTARGSIVDADALYRALTNGRISGAALDVTEPEPIPLDSPLLTLDNIIITPHIGSASRQTRDKMAMMAASNLAAGLKGEKLPDCVNPEVYG
ncbi:D-glycerate dehydrogenase [Planktothrix sp. FACHB-1355]|uniref:D-glycerate dehydrogenase n=1 Tax=Aerosakkonema funiforme FACHB-1375 TaxID=2949571 RepID=A0A926VKB3_9CYAN|nr:MULTISPECIES: D-glycerate dehydrogenase [Oscillatoriales]MBD2185456.1 D-glycerate dehydrogenase [Aerosakkonema funiforme FACHB-1375]MBD3558158.1 D-glycerate dehydrogenase [Planktothrix sp. FACHB-1355]